MKYVYLKYLVVLFALIGGFSPQFTLADGSKDLYPAGAVGHRAALRISTTTSSSYPFATRGYHYVYAKVGETITMASSGQVDAATQHIRLYGPSGQQVPLSISGSAGNIPNRAAELAGPRKPEGSSPANAYTPIYHNVSVEGIYRVEFTTSQGSGAPGLANGVWASELGSSYLNAWDISVYSPAALDFIGGRVYANVFNLSANASGHRFYGNVFVLTKDGYLYRVKANGMEGWLFTFFVNNTGFQDGQTLEPLYRSLINSTVQEISAAGHYIHSPNSADTEINVTQKIFYRPPASDMPTSASGTVPGGSTWLRNEPISPKVSNVAIAGVDGMAGQVSNRGGYVEFTAEAQGQYTIEIISPSSPEAFPKRTLHGTAIAGSNRIYWNGKDGDGNPLPDGDIPVEVSVQLQGAEVHFPYFDVEYNVDGIIIELLDKDDINTVVSDIVYWNDTGIPDVSIAGNNPSPKNNTHLPPVNSAGISSNVNGHKFAQGFGDTRSLDTWTFIKGAKETLSTAVTVNIADLEVSSLTTDLSGVISVGDEWTYTSQIRNNGPTPVFTNTDPSNGPLSHGATYRLYVPEGITIDTDPSAIGFTTGCAVIVGQPTFANGIFEAVVDMPVGCEAVFQLRATATNAVTANNGEIHAWSTLLRPRDYTDIDATSEDITVLPTDPFFEAQGVQMWYDDVKLLVPDSIDLSQTNNIKRISQLAMQADLEVEKSASAGPWIAHTDVTFTVLARNLGPSEATGVSVTDLLPDGFSYRSSEASVGSYNPVTGVWDVGTLAATPGGNEATLTIIAEIARQGSYVNRATIEGNEVDPEPDNNIAEVTLTPTEAVADLVVNKTVNNNRPLAGESYTTFSITVKNMGPSRATSVVLEDVVGVGYDVIQVSVDEGTWVAPHWSIPSLASGDSVYMEIFAAVMPSGTSYDNTATVTADEPDPDASNNSSTVAVELSFPRFTLLKELVSVNGDTTLTAYSRVGDVLAYKITVENTGNVPLYGLEVNDPQTGLQETNATLPVGEVIEYPTTYTITTADLLAGSFLNVAAATGNDPYGNTIGPEDPADGQVTVPFVPVVIQAIDDAMAGYQGQSTPVGNVLKNDQFDGQYPATIGEIDLTIVSPATPVGNAPVPVLDPATGDVVIPAGTPDGTYIITYRICEAGTAITNCDEATVTVYVASADVCVGDQTIYRLDAAATVAANPVINPDAGVFQAVFTLVSGTAIPGLGTTFTQNVEYGSLGDGRQWQELVAVGNEVVLLPKTSRDAGGIYANLPANNTDAPIVEMGQVDEEFTLAIQAGEIDELGRFNIVLSDFDVDVLPSNVSITGQRIALETVGNGTYGDGEVNNGYWIKVAGQSDVISGGLGSSTPPMTVPWGSTLTYRYSAFDDGTQPVAENGGVRGIGFSSDMVFCTLSPDLSVVKTGVVEDIDANAMINAGDQITYTFVVTNTGNVTLEDIVLAEETFTGTGTLTPIFDPDQSDNVEGTLQRGEVAVYTAVYTLTQEDIDAGGVDNLASVAVTVPPGAEAFDPVLSTPDPANPGTPGDPGIPTEVTVPANPALSFAKTGALSSDGNTVTYTFTVTNTGNVTMADIAVSDPKITGPIVLGTTALAPGESTTGTATYAVTQAEKDAGVVENSATVTGTPPFDPSDPTQPGWPIDPVRSTPDTDNPGTPGDPGIPTEVAVPGNPALSFTKVADVSGLSNPDVAGDKISYTFTVTNLGNVTLSDLVITDPLPGIPAVVLDRTEIAPGETATATVTYTLTQQDVDMGLVVNQATVGANLPNGDPFSPTLSDDPTTADDADPTVVKLISSPSLSLTKHATGEGPYALGDYINFEIVVRNTGNVTLTDMAVTDDNAEIVAGSPVATLAPGASAKVVARHRVTQDDLDAGQVVNQAFVTGNDPSGNPIPPVVSDDPDTPEAGDATVTQIGQDARLRIEKRADRASIDRLGERVGYELQVTNTGNVTLYGVEVRDPLTGLSERIAALRPGRAHARTFWTHYRVGEGDLQAGHVTNTAHAAGSDSEGRPVVDEATVRLPVSLRTIVASDDRLGPVNGQAGGTVPSVLGNDSVNDGPADSETVTLHVGGQEVTGGVPLKDAGGNLVPGVVLNPDGTVTVSPGTPGGDYTLAYTICEVLNPANCSPAATVSVRVVDPPAAGNASRVTVPQAPVGVPLGEILVPGTDGSPAVSFPDTPAGFAVSRDGQGNVVVTPGPDAPVNVPVDIPFEVTDEYGYTSRGVITVTVEYIPIGASDDLVGGVEAYRTGARGVVNVLDNDLFGDGPATLSEVSLTQVDGDASLTLNADGSVDVAQGTLPGMYTLRYRICEVANPGNCEEATVTVTVIPAALRIPNVFTPNGDGRNDYFEIEGIEGFDRIEITVINRWGNEVYRNSNYGNDWNGGSLNGGTYYYQVTTVLGGQRENYSGWVLVKRQ